MVRVHRHKYSKRLPDGSRVNWPCRKWYITYTDANGRRRREPGYTDKRATQERANEIQKRIDRQEAGILDAESLNLTAQLIAPIESHIAAYENQLAAQNVSPHHLIETLRRLRFLVAHCGFKRLADLKPDPVQNWVAGRNRNGCSPRTTNTYVGSLKAFVRWCLRNSRLAHDPFLTIRKQDENADKRRVRRALTEEELARLLKTAEERPLAEMLTIRTGKRKGLAEANVSETARAQANRTGRQRRLIYMTLVLTGLRKGELQKLRWTDLELEADQAWLTVRASVSKSGKTETLPIRADLASELRNWQQECLPQELNHLVFVVPRELVRILDRDLVAAGIAKRVKGEDGKWRIDKRDSRGRIIDVHSLRHTTASFLAKAGVAPRTAQTLMRHSDIRLTLETYSDPQLLDTVGALDVLPQFNEAVPANEMRATGTDDQSSKKLGPQLGPKGRTGERQLASSRSRRGNRSVRNDNLQLHVPATVSTSSQGPSSQRAIGFEPTTSSLGSKLRLSPKSLESLYLQQFSDMRRFRKSSHFDVF